MVILRHSESHERQSWLWAANLGHLGTEATNREKSPVNVTQVHKSIPLCSGWVNRLPATWRTRCAFASRVSLLQCAKCKVGGLSIAELLAFRVWRYLWMPGKHNEDGCRYSLFLLCVCTSLYEIVKSKCFFLWGPLQTINRCIILYFDLF